MALTANETAILAVAQKMYLVLNGVYNDVTGTDQDDFITMSIDWINMYLQELELETDWSWLRVQGATLGTIVGANDTFALGATVQRLANTSMRDVTLTKPNGTIGTWRVVNPNQLKDPNLSANPDRVTTVGKVLQFSRPFNTTEIGGVLRGDTIGFLTPVSRSDISILSQVYPQQLLVLGAAKNAVLPDVVNNTLTPAYTSKYADLLKLAIANDGSSADLDDIYRDDLSFVTGVY